MGFYRKPKKFQCPYCEKDFDKERQLKSHIKDAHPTKNFKESQLIGKTK